MRKIFGISLLMGWKIPIIYTESMAILKKATILASTKARVIWKYLVFPHNKHQIEEAQKVADDLKIDFLINYTDRTDNPKKYVMEGDDWKPELLKSKEKNKLILKKIWPKYGGPLKDLMKIVPKCIDKDEALFLSSKGYLTPCCRSAAEIEKGGANGDQFNEHYREWNINDKTFTEIAKHPFYTNLNNLVKNTPESSPYICQKNCGKVTELGLSLIKDHLTTKRPSEK
jgi:hypothetical protein